MVVHLHSFRIHAALNDCTSKRQYSELHVCAGEGAGWVDCRLGHNRVRGERRLSVLGAETARMRCFPARMGAGALVRTRCPAVSVGAGGLAIMPDAMVRNSALLRGSAERWVRIYCAPWTYPTWRSDALSAPAVA
jgi:hypothetical protein